MRNRVELKPSPNSRNANSAIKVRSNCFLKEFLLIYLVDDEDQSVEAYESNEIDFEQVVKRLEQGESVFIKQRPGKDVNLPQASHDIVTKNFGKRREL